MGNTHPFSPTKPRWVPVTCQVLLWVSENFRSRWGKADDKQKTPVACTMGRWDG